MLAAVGVVGFRGSHFRKPPLYIFPDMERQPKLRPQTANGFFANGLSSRLPVAGTIARSQPIQVGDKPVYPWRGLAGQHRPRHGHDEFRRGESAAGHRRAAAARAAACSTSTAPPATARWATATASPKRIGAMAVVANLHDKRIVELADGELFNTVSYGKSLMQGYAAQPRRSRIAGPSSPICARCS